MYSFFVNWKNKYSDAKGKSGEDLAYLAVKQLGFSMIEPVFVGWKLLRSLKRRNGQTLAWVVPQQKVAGDFRAIGAGGQAVLIEVKYRDDRLLYSDLKQHQRAYLSEHNELGGLSLLVWVSRDEVFVMRWPIEGFAPRKSLRPDQARELSISILSSYATQEAQQ